ncbi:hypothetical protein [Desulfoscipio gibsoniae]|uniref:Uncharacterized protein n=1 Tax=Desulfoscipio gibsoniae DSM 7213 TaxID=767817 RepID=R4KJ75_9FIRM|nr:hypothetical protein [Desulfoscipio gibsoniae]AGL01677.1 hypothetical protein Desgi_2251 [Desulfoscipio gibsoniae DSM 7213]
MIKLTIPNEDYLRQQLEWVKYRAAALDEIEVKLREMKELAVFARDNELTPVEAREINAKLHELQREITELDEQSGVFWLDYQ